MSPLVLQDLQKELARLTTAPRKDSYPSAAARNSSRARMRRLLAE